MAGNLSAEEYNAAMRSIAAQKVQNAAASAAAVEAAAVALAAQAAGSNVALGAPVGLPPLPVLPSAVGFETLVGMPPLPPLTAPLTAALPTLHLPPLAAPPLTLPTVDPGLLMAGIAGETIKSIEAGAPGALAMAQAQLAEGFKDQVKADAKDDDETQEGMDVAMAQQLMQLNRFYLQQRVFDTQKMVASGEMPTRFKEGFRPMQLCKQFMKSASCVRGDTCSYAHTFEELHPMSPELPGAQSAKAVEALAEEIAPSPDTPEPSLRMQRKRAMCQRLTRGGCLLGKKCPFAHSDAELGTIALAITDRVKTQICKFFEQNKCVYGKYCVNAHGEHEIGKPKPDYLCPPAKQGKEEKK
jgi:hypothetical protein